MSWGGFNNFWWNPTGRMGGKENTILKGTFKMYGLQVILKFPSQQLMIYLTKKQALNFLWKSNPLSKNELSTYSSFWFKQKQSIWKAVWKESNWFFFFFSKPLFSQKEKLNLKTYNSTLLDICGISVGEKLKNFKRK